MTVNPGLYLAVENEDHELVLQVGDGGVEAGSHQPQVGRQVRAEKGQRLESMLDVLISRYQMSITPEVLNESPVPYHGVEGLDVAREVHVEHEVVPDLFQHL